LLPTIGYINLNNYTPIEFANLIKEKVDASSANPNETKSKLGNEDKPKIPPARTYLISAILLICLSVIIFFILFRSNSKSDIPEPPIEPSTRYDASLEAQIHKSLLPFRFRGIGVGD